MDSNDLRSFFAVVLGISISKLIDYAIKFFNINIPFFLNIILTATILIIVFIVINSIEKKIKNRKLKQNKKNYF